MRFLGIQNCEVEGFGLYQTLLPMHGVRLDTFKAFDGNPLPPHEEYDAILIGGTPCAAYELEKQPFLISEAEYLKSSLAAGKPCLGICFGGQLLARLLGAGVRKADKKEIGVYELDLTPAGKADPLLAGFPARFPVFQWHGDTFDVPPGAGLLAVGADCPNQMFRSGSAVGVQFHVEVTPGEAQSWANAYADELRRFGKTGREVVAELKSREKPIRELAGKFLENFINWAQTMRRTFTIRRAIESDAKDILACLHAAFEPYRARYTRGAYEDTTLTPATIHQRLAEVTVLVAVDATGEIVGTIGYQMLREGEGHLRGMAVLPGWLGSGVARELLVQAESGLRRAGCLRVNLDTTEPLQRAVRFYEKNGFRATGRVTDFFGMPIFEYVKTLS